MEEELTAELTIDELKQAFRSVVHLYLINGSRKKSFCASGPTTKRGGGDGKGRTAKEKELFFKF